MSILQRAKRNPSIGKKHQEAPSLKPSTESLLEQIRHVSSQEIRRLPIGKDLPRLASRISVEGTLCAPPAVPRKNKITSTIDDFVLNECESISENIPATTTELFQNPSLQSALKKMRADYYFTVDSSLSQIPQSKWEEYGFPTRIQLALLKKAKDIAKPYAQEIEEEEEEEEEQEEEQEHTHPLHSARKSVGLSKPLDLTLSTELDSDDNLVLSHSEDEPLEDFFRGVWVDIRRVLDELSERLETKEVASGLSDRLNEVLSSGCQEGAEEDAVHAVFFPSLKGKRQADLDSDCIAPRVATVLKYIHQQIILLGVYRIRETLLFPMTGDVRGPDGWQILVSFRFNTITILHRKKEQSLRTAPPDERFEFIWEMRIVLDKTHLEPQSASLQISGLTFDPEISPIKKEQISAALGRGNLRV